MSAGFILGVLDRPIAFQRSFVRLTGSVTAALFLSQAVYWQQRVQGPSGEFYKSAVEWEEETGLTRREQDTARANLRELGVLLEVKRGIPARLYFRVDVDRLGELLEDFSAQNRQTVCTEPPNSMHKSAKQYAQKRQTNTETTQRLLTIPPYAPQGGPSTLVELREVLAAPDEPGVPLAVAMPGEVVVVATAAEAGAEAVWRKACSVLPAAVGVQNYRTWLQPLRGVLLESGVLTLRMPSAQFGHVPERYGEALLAATRDAGVAVKRVCFQVAEPRVQSTVERVPFADGYVSRRERRGRMRAVAA